jgi:hypothetical protein
MKCSTAVLFLLIFSYSFSQSKPFCFAFVSDTHIGSPNGGAKEDIRRTVADMNSMKQTIEFVGITEI